LEKFIATNFSNISLPEPSHIFQDQYLRTHRAGYEAELSNIDACVDMSIYAYGTNPVVMFTGDGDIGLWEAFIWKVVKAHRALAGFGSFGFVLLRFADAIRDLGMFPLSRACLVCFSLVLVCFMLVVPILKLAGSS